MRTQFRSRRNIRSGARRAVLTLMSLAALAIATGLAMAQSCIRPSFNLPGGPFPLPASSGQPGIPLAISTGTFFTREGRSPCNCDLAVALGDQGVVANRLVIMRGCAAGTYDLSTAMTLTFEGSPAAVIAGRFRTDASQGLDDLILVVNTDRGGTEIHVMEPAANGQYATISRLNLAGNPLGAAKGDFDGDGALDFAVMGDTGTLTVMRGDGAGQFSTATVSGLSGQAKSLATGMFTGRAERDDIAVALIDPQGKINIAVVSLADTGSFGIARNVPTGESGVEASIAAANLSSAGQWRDIAVASSNSNTSEAGGRVKLLLGRADGQGFTDGAVLTTGFRPRVINITDMNGDGAGDLVAAFFADTLSGTGSITIFQGQAAEKRFAATPMWRTLPSPINPSLLATARFATDVPGLVAANSGLNTISVYLSNGTGVFVTPSLRMTEVPADARLFVTGDFRSTSGDRKVLDLAFTSPDHENGGEVLSVFLNDETGKFNPVVHGEGDPPSFTGKKPLLMVSGRFNSDAATDLAIIDENPDDGLKRPVLRILLGTGGGRFKVPDGLSEFILGAGEKPVAMVTGHFRNASAGANVPLDIAIASVSAPGAGVASPGKLTILINDGSGQFPDEKDRLFEPIGFVPDAMVASNRFRQEGKYDLAIKQSQRNTFALYLNRGDGRFPSPERFSAPAGDDQNGFESADPVFLVDDIDANNLEDIVLLDDDLSLDVYSNKGAGRFKFDDVVAMKSLAGKIDLSSARFRLDKFGDGPMGLAALVQARNDDGTTATAILTLKGDSIGIFSAPDLVKIRLPVTSAGGAIAVATPATFFDTATVAQQGELSFNSIPAVISGQFAKALHGNEKPDLWFLVRFEGKKVEAGVCPNNPLPNPGPEKVKVSCPDLDDPAIVEAVCNKRCPPRFGCIDTCVHGRCKISPEECVKKNCVFKFIPQNPYCGTATAASYFTIVGNTCND